MGSAPEENPSDLLGEWVVIGKEALIFTEAAVAVAGKNAKYPEAQKDITKKGQKKEMGDPSGQGQ